MQRQRESRTAPLGASQAVGATRRTGTSSAPGGRADTAREAPEGLFSFLADAIEQLAGEAAGACPELLATIRGGEETLGQARAHAALEWANDIAVNLKGLRQAREAGNESMIDAFTKLVVRGVKQVLALAAEARAETAASSETDAARRARLKHVRHVAANEGVRPGAEPLSRVAMRAIRRRHQARAERPQTPVRARAGRIRGNGRVRGSRRSTAAGGGDPGGSDDDDDVDACTDSALVELREIRERVVRAYVGPDRRWDACASGLIDWCTFALEQGGAV